MAKLAFIFPGQGSQALKMMDGFAESAIVKATFATAASALDIDFWAMLHEDSAENINQTVNTQPLLLTASYATYLAWLEQGGTPPAYVAGHSLGEYSALVVSGVIDLVTALHLVRKRALLMQQAVAPGIGAMAAVLGLSDEQVIAACAQVMNSGAGVIQGVNFNSPGQVVIAGTKIALEQASVILKAQGARKVLPLPVSVPSHCQLMEPAAAQLAVALESISFKPPQIALIQNVDGKVASDVIKIKQGLVQQLHSAVLWSECVRTLAANQVDIIVECGPGKVLSGLNKRILASSQSFNLHSPADIATLMQQIALVPQFT